jgi:hypothetical protein
MNDVTLSVAALFGVSAQADAIDPRKYGETPLYAIQALWLFALSVVVAGVWTSVDRRSAREVAATKWIRLLLRLGLAAQMLEYGMTKIFPTQFPSPSLSTLVTPIGDLSMNGLLWASIGAAPGYGVFTGFAELLAGVLLFVPRTALAGALVCLADLAQVLALNLSYDIGLKLTTIHLIAITLFLLAPDARRLWSLFVMGRAGPASTTSALFKDVTANRTAVWTQAAIGVGLIATFAYINLGFLKTVGQASPRSALYGIWNVESLAVNGEAGPPELNDYDRRWRRAIFDTPDVMTFQRTDDSFARYGAVLGESSRTLVLTKGDSRDWKATFTFTRVDDDRLILEGAMDGHDIRAELQRVAFDTLPLLNSTFRWVRPVSP